MSDVRKQWSSTVSAVPGATSGPEMMISTMAVDRDGDRVIPEGGDFTNARQNFPLLWSHDLRSIPIGAVTAWAVIPEQGVRARWRWLENDEFAGRVRNAWEQGVVRAASLGFLSHEWRPNQFGGVDHLRWEPIEASLTPVGSNPEAVRTLKALGLWSEKGGMVYLDDPENVGVHALVRAAVREALGPIVTAAVTRTIGRLRGRVD